MGWWSATILGGDTPLDILGDMGDVLGVDSDDETKGIPELYGYDFTKSLLEDKSNIKKLQAYANKSDDKSIAYQILGVIIMGTGAKITGTLKEDIIKHTKKDDWYKTKDPERVAYIDDFIKTLTEYKAEAPVFLKLEGLFQKIAEKMENKTPGLINKTW